MERSVKPSPERAPEVRILPPAQKEDPAMNVLVVGKETEPLLTKLRKFPSLPLVTQNPDLIITYGGDGTLLYAENLYPGIPKLPIRRSIHCEKCSTLEEDVILTKLANGELKQKGFPKLQVSYQDQTYVAMNDCIIRNAVPYAAVRLYVSLNGNRVTGDVIGDGVVAATPFGSSGYFQSITRKSFKENFGLAFNNPTKLFEPIYFNETERITVTITRGPAQLAYDNAPKVFPLTAGAEVGIQASPLYAYLMEIDNLHNTESSIWT